MIVITDIDQFLTVRGISLIKYQYMDTLMVRNHIFLQTKKIIFLPAELFNINIYGMIMNNIGVNYISKYSNNFKNIKDILIGSCIFYNGTKDTDIYNTYDKSIINFFSYVNYHNTKDIITRIRNYC